MFSFMNMIGGLSNIMAIPHYNVNNFMSYFIVTSNKGFKRFVIGTIFIIILLGIFGFASDFSPNHEHKDDFAGVLCSSIGVNIFVNLSILHYCYLSFYIYIYTCAIA